VHDALSYTSSLGLVHARSVTFYFNCFPPFSSSERYTHTHTQYTHTTRTHTIQTQTHTYKHTRTGNTHTHTHKHTHTHHSKNQKHQESPPIPLTQLSLLLSIPTLSMTDAAVSSIKHSSMSLITLSVWLWCHDSALTHTEWLPSNKGIVKQDTVKKS
jgi:hypothetical protein